MNWFSKFFFVSVFLVATTVQCGQEQRNTEERRREEDRPLENLTMTPEAQLLINRLIVTFRNFHTRQFNIPSSSTCSKYKNLFGDLDKRGPAPAA